MSSCFIVVVLFFDFAASVQKIYGPIWSYDDETAWPGGLCKKGGKRQSPIDIRTSDVISDFEKQFIKHGGLKFIGYDGVLMTGINNGHTIQFSTEGEKSMHPTITGGPLKYLYRLEQLHFHWLSEHAIDGVKYPMEIHFVHVRSDLKVAEALHRRDGLAIVSVFCNVQAELNEHQREATEELMQYIPQLLNIGDRLSGVLLDLRKLLSPQRDTYFTYLGSLTSPECNEVVVWIIFDKPTYISDANVHTKTTDVDSYYNEQPFPRKLLSPQRDTYFTYLGSLTSPECNEVVVWIIFDKPTYISDANVHTKTTDVDSYYNEQPFPRKLLSPQRDTYFTYLGSLTSPECNEVVVWIIFDKPTYISDANVHTKTTDVDSYYNEQPFPRKLLSPQRDTYFTYLGSLTSPECNEVVVWIIFDKPIYISDAHYRLFGKVGVGRHNFRSLQKMSHHLVFQPPEAIVTTPRVIVVIADAFHLVSTFFRNITRFMTKI